MRTVSTILAAILLMFSVTVSAQSQCVGLSSGQCKSNDSCSWRKASVNKNNVKTKAHCRALPNKAKSSSKKKTVSKASTKKKESTSKKKLSVKEKEAKKKEKAAKKKEKTSVKKKASKKKEKAKNKVKKKAKKK